ncbi:sodium:calcium antiporter [Methanoculleus sp. FWC-SCC1]|uniref:Sodium:calcium antiporter n=1 Tax=Methanoculleus frigidifontis TaxID=2584085 RepID=A0ABT8M9G5_9EURY|nr:cache domain-containing protein [Methanoculleus sp. FWC-SCC1]MDN7024565.1 sodium:calcium antiporter [Methanoculleus sp. FWC-SCC1]
MRVHATFALLLVIAVLGAGCTGDERPSPQTSQESVIRDAVSGINDELESVEAAVGENARVLGESGLTGAAGREALKQTLLEYPWAESSLVIAKDGVVVMAVPENYGEIVGRDLSYQPQVQRANREQVPIVSEVFPLEEGFSGISQSYPIFGTEYLGYTDITYRPDILIGRVIAPIINGTPYDAWATQTDGRVIYDTTPEEIGKNLFSDPVYQSPGLQEAFTRIVSEPSGSIEYSFYDLNWERNVTKEAVWDTAGIDGAEWRIVITRSLDAGERQKVAGSGIPPAANATDEMKDFVNEAAAYAREHGRTESLSAFNNPEGEFVRGELYIFAYSMNGTVLALPFQQGLIGTDRRGVHDPNGVAYIDAACRVAAEGGGSIYYVYPNPANGYAEELKLGYVAPVDDEWFVGSGVYIPGVGAGFTASEKDALVQRVKAARDYAQELGKEAASAAFNDLSGSFADGGAYIFAYGTDGETLALPYQPEFIGTNRLGFADRYGVKIIDWEIAAAKAGSGFVYVTYYNPDTGGDGLKLCYVAPVDDEWFVGSGVYAAET